MADGNVHEVVRVIDSSVERLMSEPTRPHLGASVMGKECMRSVWYHFRWAKPQKFSGRMLRLFQRGKDEEPRIVDLLRNAGIIVVAVDPATGKQYRHTGIGGHMGGSLDAILNKVPTRLAGEDILGEFKTHNFDSFKALKEDGVRKSKLEHFAQMQLYMKWHQLKCALYIAVCKDDDELYCEFVEFDAEYAEDAERRGESVIRSETAPLKLSRDPTFFKCKLCSFHSVCHGKGFPEKNCRTCAHSTAEIDDGATTGRWSCAYWKQPSIPLDFQRKGCDHHVFNPAMLQNYGEYRGGDTEQNYAEYVTKAGTVFRNGTKRPGVYPSDELPWAPETVDLPPSAAQSALVADFGAKYVEPCVVTTADLSINAAVRAQFESKREAPETKIKGKRK